jgi:hypothetical protein
MLIIAVVAFFVPTQTYIFHVFGWIWGGAAVFTFLNCFFVLPIILTLLGPRSAEVADEIVDLKLFDTKAPGKVMGGEVEFKD